MAYIYCTQVLYHITQYPSCIMLDCYSIQHRQHMANQYSIHKLGRTCFFFCFTYRSQRQTKAVAKFTSPGIGYTRISFPKEMPSQVDMYVFFCLIFIDREAGEIICLVASVRLSVCTLLKKIVGHSNWLSVGGRSRF